MYLASLDGKTASDVAKSGVIDIIEGTGGQGWMIAAMLLEMKALMKEGREGGGTSCRILEKNGFQVLQVY